MVIQNGLVFTPDCRFERLDLAVGAGRVLRAGPPGSLDEGERMDASGCYVLPGLVDIHTHGAAGRDFCDADADALRELLAFYAAAGTTSVLGTTMSYPVGRLREVIEAMRPLFGAEGNGAVLRGVNLEGPFLDPAHKGAQNGDYLAAPDIGALRALDELSGGVIRLVDVAPELEGGLDFIRAAAGICAVSLAHTGADYETACAAFAAGASHVTHLYNAMPPHHHREPGVVGAAMDHARFVELIADGQHLHPSVLRGAFRAFGPERVCLISDSMRACGMPDGDYTLGGQPVRLRGGRATLADGSLAGSAATLADCVRFAVSAGVPLASAVRAATANPARAVGLCGELGGLEPGKRADILLWDGALRPCGVMVGGVWVA